MVVVGWLDLQLLEMSRVNGCHLTWPLLRRIRAVPSWSKGGREGVRHLRRYPDPTHLPLSFPSVAQVAAAPPCTSRSPNRRSWSSPRTASRPSESTSPHTLCVSSPFVTSDRRNWAHSVSAQPPVGAAAWGERRAPPPRPANVRRSSGRRRRARDTGESR